ncbi:DNA polymerase (family 10) [Halarsenatibacter silvermanii]|uniref:DNA polymerase beta n=2 Tax=Halarsenatibacter silvermanii TaxID=321763 RepID=A0A1G9K386_9FIRM|nr:DNA polymerase (family 10) [Halarsenatibacter silvermanii]
MRGDFVLMEISARDISQILSELADLMEIKGDNQYRISAYERAARSLRSLEEDFEELYRSDRLTEISGVGEGIAATIKEIVEEGSLQDLEELKRELPDGIIDLLQIPGLGPKRAHKLFYELQIGNVRDLKNALEDGAIRDLSGFGEKLEKKIAEGLRRYREYQKYISIDEAEDFYSGIKQFLDSTSVEIEEVFPAGSLRRKKELLKDVDMVVSVDSADQKELHLELETWRRIDEVERSRTSERFNNAQILECRLNDGLQLDIFLVSPADLPWALLMFTGSDLHLENLRQKAKTQGFDSDTDGIFCCSDEIDIKEEQDIYRALDLPYIIPELREGQGETEAAVCGELPESPGLKDIKGDLHVHTNFSDGSQNLEEMVQGAIARGYDYLAITDHSVSLRIADGLTPEELARQAEIIEEMNEKYEEIEVFKGTEADILPSGELDYSREVLAELDLVIASVHSGFNQTELEMTERIIKAVENPLVDIIGHPQGRLLKSREAYSVDMEAVIESAASNRTCLEINSFPSRLDLDDNYARLAGEKGVKMAINTDAHRTGEYENMIYGINVGRRGWLDKNDIINTYSLTEFKDFVSQRRI